MIIDTSAVIAILRHEPTRQSLLEQLSVAGGAQMSTATYVEVAIVVDREGDPVLSRELDEILAILGITVVPFDAEHSRLARDAYRDFGRGSGHPARLNLGDSFSYALAKATGEPLLFVGDDFTHTDIEPALRDQGLTVRGSEPRARHREGRT